MAITVINASNIKANDLISVCNPIPINFVVSSSTRPSIAVSIYNCFLQDEISDSNAVVKNLYAINYKSSGNSYYFTIDLQNIVKSSFVNNDDYLQSPQNWINVTDLLEDFVIEVYATNGTETDTYYLPFTGIKMAKQFSDDNVVSKTIEQTITDENIISVSDKKLNIDETIYGGSSNVIYIYSIVSDDSSIITENRELGYYFVDYDDVYFTVTDGEDEILTKEI